MRIKDVSTYTTFQEMVRIAHVAGLSVRLNLIGIKGGVDTPEKLKAHILVAKEMGIEQVTWRPMFVLRGHRKRLKHLILTFNEENAIRDMVEEEGTILLQTNYGAEVYDFYGQNVSISNCLTETLDPETIRQLIFFPNGELRYSWMYEGARIL